MKTLKTSHFLVLCIGLAFTLVACDDNTIGIEETKLTTASFPEIGKQVVPALPDEKSGAPRAEKGLDLKIEPGSYNLSQAEHDRLYQLMQQYQEATGEKYVGFLSQKRKGSDQYSYKYRSFKAPKWLEERGGGEILPYIYVVKPDREGDAIRVFFAFIPRDPNAILLIREWVAIQEGRIPAVNYYNNSGKSARASGVSKVSNDDCAVDEQIIYYDECDCYGYTDLPICAYNSGSDLPIFFDEGDGWDDWEDVGGCGGFGCDDVGGGGDGGGDGGGGSDGIITDEYVQKYELTSKMEACGIVDHNQQADLFDAMFRKYTSMNEPITQLDQTDPSNPHNRQFDGIRRDANGQIYLIFEGKFSESSSAFKYDQSIAHLNILEEYWNTYTPGNYQWSGPHYLTASLVGHNADITFGNHPLISLLPKAIEKGVSWVHYTFLKNSDGDYFFRRKYMTPFYVTLPSGITLPVPLQILPDLSGSVLFRLDDCSQITSLLTHP